MKVRAGRRSGHRQDRAGRLLLVLSRRTLPRSEDGRHQQGRLPARPVASELWLRPNPGTTASACSTASRGDRRAGTGEPRSSRRPAFGQWLHIARRRRSWTASPGDRRAGGRHRRRGRPLRHRWRRERPRRASAIPPSLIYQTVAHQRAAEARFWYGDPAEIAAACNNLAILTGNIGRAGGGVARSAARPTTRA